MSSAPFSARIMREIDSRVSALRRESASRNVGDDWTCDACDGLGEPIDDDGVRRGRCATCDGDSWLIRCNECADGCHPGDEGACAQGEE